MKPRMKILMSALSLVLVLTIGIIGVFALTQINIDAKLRVRFIAQKNVYATVSAKSYKSSQEAPVETLSPLVIDGTEEQGYEGNLEFDTLIEVTQAETVDYVFEFKNTTNVVTNPELVIEPVIEFANDFANWTMYYMADTEEGYKQLSNLDGTGDSYTYIELAKGESVRVRLSINSTNAEEDVELDDSTISFRLYTAPTAPTLYEDDAVIVSESHLYYEVGETVALGYYPKTKVDSTLKETLEAEYAKLENDEDSALLPTGRSYDYADSMACTEYEYNGNRYARRSLGSEDYEYFLVEKVEFIVVDAKETGVTVLSKNIIAPFYNGSFEHYAESGVEGLFVGLLEDMQMEDIALATTIENVDYNGATDTSSTVKMWAPLSDELIDWYALVEGNIKIAGHTDFVSDLSQTFPMCNYYILRDGGNGYANFIDTNGDVVTDLTEGYDYFCVRPVTRIAQLDYKGF